MHVIHFIQFNDDDIEVEDVIGPFDSHQAANGAMQKIYDYEIQKYESPDADDSDANTFTIDEGSVSIRMTIFEVTSP